jgi:membrane protein DedA with SNARE-associated domain
MDQAVRFLTNHGVAVLFVAVLAEQAGLPVPSVPLLLAIGSLASLGRMNLTVSIGVALGACLVADFSWYQVGRRGRSNLLRRCAERSLRSENRMRYGMTALNHHGIGVLLLAKFLPGPNLASPLAGMSGLTRSRFLIFDGIASIIWAGGYLTVGYTCSEQLQRVTAYGSRFGLVLLVVVACVFAVVALVRSVRRRWPQWRALLSCRLPLIRQSGSLELQELKNTSIRHD